MPLFPMYVDIKDKNILVVGGGKVAQRKIEKLLPFSPKITVVAISVNDYIKRISKENENIFIFERRFEKKDLENKDIVIVAASDIKLQEEIYKECVKKGIPVNSVDSPEFCSFIFPALIVRGDLVIGISSSGKVPGFSAKVRELLEQCLPQDIEEILQQVHKIRKQMPKGEERQKKILEILKQYF